MAHPTQLIASETTLVVVDVQEKLMPKIHGGQSLLANIEFLLDAAAIIGLDRIGTEQYPAGLGPTVASLAAKLPATRPDKVGFSCCAIESFVPKLHEANKTRIILTGIESHVCILNTALDLLAESFWVYLPVDAISSRYLIDHETALRRLEGAGVILTTSETVVFELTGGAGHPRFKEISALIRKRSV